MHLIAIVVFISAAVLLVSGVLASLRKLPGNPVIGLRLAEVRASQEAWDKVHAVAGPLWILAAVVWFFTGALFLQSSGLLWALAAILSFAGALILSVSGNIAARAARVYQEAGVLSTADAAEGAAAGGCGGNCNCGDAAAAEGNSASAAIVDVQALRQAAQQADNPAVK